MNILTWISGMFHLLLIFPQFTDAVGSKTSGGPESLASKVESFKVNIHRVIEGSRVRKKREINGPDGPSDLQMRVDSADAVDLPYLSNYKLTFWTPVHHYSRNQVLVGTQEGHLILFEISETDDMLAHIVAVSYEEEMSIKAKAFNYLDEQWFIVLQSARNQTWIRLYLKVGRGLEQRQSITLDGESDFDFVTVKGVHYMALATYQSFRNQASLRLYHWTQTQFDFIASRTVYGPRSIACWVLDGTLYIVLAQRVEGKDEFKYGSPVYLYNTKDSRGLVMQQMLSIYGPVKVLHFQVGSSHYIIFTGRQNAAIYWWTNNQFLMWQIIENTAQATDAAVIALASGEVVIVIALKEEVLFATLDSSGHYVVTFTISFSGYSLSSVQFMYSGKAYYALTTSLRGQSQQTYKLTLKPYFFPAGSSLDSLRQCLDDVVEVLDDRQNEMNNIHVDLSRAWLKNGDKKVTAVVYVAGKVASNQKSVVSEILVVTDRKILPDLSLNAIENSMMKVNSIANSMQQNLWTSARKSIQQTIVGPVHFQYPVYIPSMDLRFIKTDLRLNGVPISKINNRALRTTGEQAFAQPVQTFNIHGSNIEAKLVNGITTNDFLLLKGKQHVYGGLEYFDVLGNDVITQTINSIPTGRLATLSSTQKIEDLKSFSYVESGSVVVHGQTNGEILRNLGSQIVRTTTDDEIKGRIHILSPLHVSGDIFSLGKINGIIDLVELKDNSVKNYSPQNLTGQFTFQQPVMIQNDVSVKGLVNNVNVTQLLTLTTSQTLTGQFIFEILSVENVLSVELVNDMKLSKVAVLKTYEPQFVSGIKTFTEDVTADFVDMTDFVTLDGVDISLLVQDIVKHIEGKVKQDHTFFHKVKVLGNLTVADGINDRAVFDLPRIVWLKNTLQVVEIPVVLKKLLLRDDLEATYVNTIRVDRDIVRSFGEETIVSVKYFEHNVVVSTGVDVTDGAMINGMKIITVKTELNDFTEEGTVHGRKILNQLVVNGNLNPVTLNNFEIFDLIRPKEYQTISVPLTIPSELTVIHDKLKSATIWFNTFNSRDVRSYLKDSLSKARPKEILKKDFSSIKATALSLPESNSINRIPLSWLLGRIVTLNSPQHILSDTTFSGNLKSLRLTVVDSNGEDLSSLLRETVLLDHVGLIPSAEFLGAFKVPSLFAKKSINEIDLSILNQNVIDKSKESDIKTPVMFMSNTEFGKLITSFKIDQVDWNDLVFIKRDEALGSLWLMSDAYFLSNIFTTGLFNECDLLQLQQRAVYSNKTNQLIQEDIKVESVEIVGNVKIEDVVNDVAVGDLLKTLILTTGDQVLTSDVVLNVGTRVAHIDLSGTADVKLSDVIADAVKRSQPQEIKGHKKFRTFQTDLLNANNLFISKHMSLVNVSDLFDGIVQKHDYQLIEGEKIFTSLKADVAIVEGHLNGLGLPNDIVKTDTSETISSPIFFMSDLILVTDLSVQGLIDGTNLSNLVRDRVTLSTDQEVSSSLNILSKVKIQGDLNVDGIVNGLVLDLIAKTSKNMPLNSYKVFLKDLRIDGSLNTSSVNGYKIQNLAENILKHNEEEFIRDLQMFKEPVRTGSHLFADWINSISLSGIASTFFSLVSNLSRTLSYLETLSYGFLQQLTRQADIVTNRISKFAYFILLQEINLGPTMKILQGYRLEHSTSEFSHSMVIWTSRKHCSYLEKCCHEEFTHWVRVKRSGHLMIDSEPEQGRLYPIHNPAPVTTDKDFFMWTNATSYQPKWCVHTKDEKMLLASFTDMKFLEVFMDIRSSPTLSDIKSFRRDYLYTVAGFYYDKKENKYSSAVVYKFNEILREWSTHQILPSYGVLSLDVTSYFLETDNELLLAVGTGTASPSYVYKWEDIEHKFTLIQDIPSKYVTSTLWLTHGPVQLLAMASVEEWPSKDAFCSDLVKGGGGINIYTYDGSVRWNQNIPLGGVVSLVHFTLHGDTFLVAASNELQTVFVYEWRGYAGFDLIQSVFVGEVTHLNTYGIDDDLYVTVATVTGPAKVLKVVVQGQHKVTDILSKEPSLDTLRDEAKKEKTTC